MTTSPEQDEQKMAFSLEEQQLPQDLHVPLSKSHSNSSSVSSGELKDTINTQMELRLPPRAPTSPNSRPTSPLSIASSSSSLTQPPPPPPRAGLVRILSNMSVGSESPTCSICLDPMTPIDHQHPLLCPTRHCHFNLCVSCIASLISSSKDDFELASDGNAHVKVFLNCPNCRSDLSGTIRDILLLRKVDTVMWLTSMKHPPKLTPSQERTKNAMKELDVQEAIQKARDVEEQFWANYNQKHNLEQDDDDSQDVIRQQLTRLEVSVDPNNNPLEELEDEEWGVEADLDTGVHSSFRLPPDQQLFVSGNANPQSNNKDNESSNNITSRKNMDNTLFAGLEFCMTYAEKLQITRWMASGEVDNLVKAAVLLRQLEKYARQGVTPAKRQASINRRASVYEIVDETRKVHDQQQKELSTCELAPNPAYYLTSTRTQSRQQQVAVERRQLDRALQEQALFLERYPLPVRMPKYVELELRDPTSRQFPLRFCNDSWDGTVLDAYSKITITGRAPNWTVTRKKTQHAGVFHVLSLGKYRQHYGCIEMTLDQPPRVLVASVQGEGGRQGVIKGDVVTHIDGREFHGTVDELMALLQSKIKDGNAQTFQMILNAEPSVAEALKRRATVLE